MFLYVNLMYVFLYVFVVHYTMYIFVAMCSCLLLLSMALLECIVSLSLCQFRYTSACLCTIRPLHSLTNLILANYICHVLPVISINTILVKLLQMIWDHVTSQFCGTRSSSHQGELVKSEGVGRGGRRLEKTKMQKST